MKFGLEIELLAYDKAGNRGNLSSGFNKFRRSLGETVDFKYFNDYPRYNAVQKYSFLSKEGMRFYLESPKTVEVVTPPVQIDGSGNGSNYLVKMLKQGVNDVLKHYSHLDFVPYSIHVNLSSLGDLGNDRFFWSEVSPMTLFLGTNSLSKGVRARLYDKRNSREIMDRLDERIEILIDGETIMVENQLESLCKYYETVLSSPLRPGELNFVMDSKSDIKNVLDTVSEDKINLYNFFNSFEFGKTFIPTDIKQNLDLLNFNFKVIEFLKKREGTPSLDEFIPLLDKTSFYQEIKEKIYHLDKNIFQKEESDFLTSKFYHEAKDIGLKDDLSVCDFLSSNLSQLSDTFDIYDNLNSLKENNLLIQRDSYFKRLKGINGNNNGQFLPKKFNSIDYNVVLNSDKLFDIGNKRLFHGFGELTKFSNLIESLDWKDILFKSPKLKEKFEKRNI